MTTPKYLGVSTLTTCDQRPEVLCGFASLLIGPSGGELTALLPQGAPGDQLQVWLLVGSNSTRMLGEATVSPDLGLSLSFEPGPGLLADLTGRVRLRLLSGQGPLAEGLLCPLTCGPQAEVHSRMRPAGPAGRSASGTVVLQTRNASLSLELRGLPGPAVLGRAEPNGPVFEVYQVWVGHSTSGRKELLGELAQRQGSHWSFHQSGAQAALRADTIMVVPASRTGMRKTGPPILVGSLPSLHSADSG